MYSEVAQVPLLIRSRRPERRTIERPVSLRYLKDYLLGVDERLLEADQEVITEAFVHAPPRWARTSAAGRTILFAAGGEPPTDAIGAWLRANHPRIEFRDLEGAEVDGARRVQSARDALVEHFAGFRRGLYVHVPRAMSTSVRITHVGDPWVWCDRPVTVARDEAGRLAVDVEAPERFGLIFAPSTADGVVIEVDGKELSPGERPPRPLPDDRVVAWLDPGRPPAVVRGLQETLERLRSLGYIAAARRP